MTESHDIDTGEFGVIRRLEPEAFLQFKYAKYFGVQCLFQDAAATIPVENVGDPIGEVKNPFTGEILAVQTTDAARPVWGGVEVGANFGSGAYLLMAQSALSGDLVESLIEGGGSVMTAVTFPDDDETRTILGWDNSVDDTRYQFRRAVNSTTLQTRRRSSDGSGTGVSRSSGILPRVGEPVSVLSVSVDADDHRHLVDTGDDDTHDAGVTPDSVGGLDVQPAIGAWNDGGSIRQTLDGSIRFLAVFDRIVDDAVFLRVAGRLL